MKNDDKHLNERLKSLPHRKNLSGTARFLEQRADQYDGFVDDLNHYLQRRYSFKSKPILSIRPDRGPIDVCKMPSLLHLYLRFKPGSSQYTRYSIAIGEAYFHENQLSETKAFFHFLLSQSEQCEFLEIYVEKYSSVPKSLIQHYEFNKFEGKGGREGWQISCEDLRKSISKPFN